MANDSYTEEFSEIMSGPRERASVREILNAWADHGLPDDFYGEGVKFAFNRNSGHVFLINEEYQCAMLNGDKLESFYTTPYNGIEGFWDELLEEFLTMHPEDQEFVRDIANGRYLPELEA